MELYICLLYTSIPLHLFDGHLIALGHDLVGAFACVLRVNLARSAGALVLDGLKLHFQSFGPLTGEDFFTPSSILCKAFMRYRRLPFGKKKDDDAPSSARRLQASFPALSLSRQR